jgi:hypothetical protein
LEEEIRDFKCATREEFYAQTLEKQSDLVAFREEWERAGQRLPWLRQFCPDIPTVFLGTSAVESDFCVLNWQYDEFRSSLTYFSLEGIMLCKHFKKLQNMKHSVSLHNDFFAIASFHTSALSLVNVS